MGTRWWYRVRATGVSEDSAHSLPDDATLADVLDSPPSDLEVDALNATQVSVDFGEPLDLPAGCTYTIERAPDSSGSPGSFSAVATGVTSLPHTVSGQSPGSRYHFRAKAVKGGLTDSPYSRVRAAATLVDRPQNVVATHDTDGCFEVPVAYRIDVVWDNLNDEGEPRNDVGTQWEYRVEGSSTWVTAGSAGAGATSVTLTVANSTDRIRGRYVGGGTAWVESFVSVECPE